MSEKSDGDFIFRCSHCSKKLKAKLKSIGRELKCPSCSADIIIPDPTEVSTPPQGDSGTKPELGQSNHSDRNFSHEAGQGVLRPSLFDVDELVLEQAAIENLDERRRDSEAIQQARAAERRRRLAAEEQRQNQPTIPAEVVQPHSRRQTYEAQFKDSYTMLEPDESSDSTSSESDRSKKSVFENDLPDLVAPNPPENESPSDAAESDLDRIVAALGKQAISIDLTNLTEAGPPEVIEDQYRVTCPTCGTLQYVTQASQGLKIKCPDCTSKYTIPPPPPNWKPSRVSSRHKQFNEDSPLGEEFELQQIDRERRQQTKAMLDRAEVELSEEEREQNRYDGVDFDTYGFLRRTFGFAMDPVAVGIMFGYAVIFALVFGMLQFGLSGDGSAFSQGVMLLCALTAPVLGVVFGMPMISAALAQLEAAANRQSRVTDWPSMNIFDHFGDVMAVSVALAAAAIPGFLLGSWLGGDLATAGRIQITGVMLTTFLLFPIFYLSILDSNILLQLVSSDVVRSIKEVSEAWGGFYLKTLIVFSFTLIVWYLLLGQGKSPVLGAFAGAMLPGLVFFTFHQLGLLADSISENLSPKESTASEDSAGGEREEIEPS